MNSNGTQHPMGLAIARMRAKAGLSLRQLAADSGIPHSTIHALEQGRIQRPPYETLDALAAALGVDAAALTGRQTRPRRKRVGGKA